MKNELTLLTEARTAAQTGQAVALREAALLSQGELARAIGVSPAAVSRWESGRRLPTGDEAIRYARILRVLRREQGNAVLVSAPAPEHVGKSANKVLEPSSRDRQAACRRQDRAAALLGVSLELFNSAVLPGIRVARIGRRVIVPVSELEKWLAQHSALTLEEHRREATRAAPRALEGSNRDVA